MNTATPPSSEPSATAVTTTAAIIKKAGLTDSQAKAYLALIEHGALTPARLAELIGETRTNGYMVCEKLASLGLATQKEGTGSQVYFPESPAKIRGLLTSRQKELKNANDALNGILPQLLSEYSLTTDKPGVVYLEGKESLQLLYDDIIATGEVLQIFPSSHDRDNPTIAQIIDSQIQRQRTAGIKTEALIRKSRFEHFTGANDELFEARLGLFESLDAQIMMYGNNVALTTFGTSIITTIITNPVISQTFKELFRVQWALASAENQGTR